MTGGLARGARWALISPLDIGAWILALSIGAGASVQAFLMAEGSQRLGADRAAFVMFGIGLLIAAAWSIISRRARGGAVRIVADLRARRLPWWAVMSGLGGALFVLSQGLAVEPLGVAVFGMTFLAGQVVGAILLDALGATGMRRRPTAARLAGAGLAIAGSAIGAAGQGVSAPPPWIVALVLLVGAIAAGVGAASGRTLRSARHLAPTATVNVGVGFLAVGVIVVATGAEMPPFVALLDPGLIGSALFAVLSIAVVSVLVARRGVLELAIFIALGQLTAGVVLDVVDGNAPSLPTYVGVALTLAAVVWIGVGSRSMAPPPG
ncbi:MAG: DMT family transporter [Pseudolysinimonas sp.]|uniref:DMT family transporter n=1 Tax=Pseudolysinimonas sp. TaxID=2680009 RepID=UPI003C76DA67